MLKITESDNFESFFFIFGPWKLVWTFPHEKINQCLTDINQCLTDIFKI